jgi:hypothetical protein
MSRKHPNVRAIDPVEEQLLKEVAHLTNRIFQLKCDLTDCGDLVESMWITSNIAEYERDLEKVMAELTDYRNNKGGASPAA